MAKTMTIEHNDVKYVLEYTRKSVEMMERQGFEIEELQRKPMTYLPALFAGAFLAHHRYVKRDVIDKIYAQLPNKGDMLGKLVEMYSEPIVALMDDPEAEGNASWTVDCEANRRPIKRGEIPPSTLTRTSFMRFSLITLQ